jgi:hypothetical protein
MRMGWIYPIVAAGMTFLFWQGLRTSLGIAIFMSVGIAGALVGFSFMRHKAFLYKPQNQALYRDCVVSLSDDEVRQDFTDGSFMAIKLFAVKALRDVGDFYFVFATPKHAIYVPKTAFASAEESHDFADRLKALVPKR